MTYRAQPRPEPPCSRDQCRDLLTGVDIGGDPWPVSWKQVLRRDLAGRVERRQMAREPAHDAEPLTPIRRMRLPRQPRPVHRQVSGNPPRAGLLEKGHETFQQAAILRHLEPEPAP